MSKLKVYGWTDAIYGPVRAEIEQRSGKRCDQVRAVVAATSVADACRFGGVTRYHAKNHMSVSGNAADIAAAMSDPGAVFVRGNRERDDAPYLRWVK